MCLVRTVHWLRWNFLSGRTTTCQLNIQYRPGKVHDSADSFCDEYFCFYNTFPLKRSDPITPRSIKKMKNMKNEKKCNQHTYTILNFCWSLPFPLFFFGLRTNFLKASKLLSTEYGMPFHYIYLYLWRNQHLVEWLLLVNRAVSLVIFSFPAEQTLDGAKSSDWMFWQTSPW